MGSGLDGYIAIARETTPGTYETPGRALEFTSEGIALEIDRIPSEGIRAGRRVAHKWKPGARRVQGPIDLEVGPQGIGLVFDSAMGGTVLTEAPSTGGNTSTTKTRHVFTPGSLAGKTLSAQVGRPDVNGVVHPFSYNGLAITDWEMSISAQELLKMSVSTYGKNESTTEPSVSPVYNTYDPFSFVDGSLQITPEGAAAVDVCVADWSMSASNNLATDRYFICAADANGESRLAIENDLREYSGSFTGDFEDLTWYNWFVNGEEAKMIMTFENAAEDIIRITQNVRFDGETTSVGGRELLSQTMTYMATSGLNDADAITIELFTDDATI